MSWFNDNPNRVIDARLAYESAGAMGRGVAGTGKAMLDYGQIQYKKKRDKKNDENLANTNDVKLKVSENNLKGQVYRGDSSVKSATIKATSNDRRTLSNEKIANINSKATLQKANILYHTSTDTANINRDGKIKTAQINAKIKKYSTDVGERNNKRTNRTNLENNKRSTETQRYVTDKQLYGTKFKAKEQTKAQNKKLLAERLKNAKTKKERQEILSESILDMDF